MVKMSKFMDQCLELLATYPNLTRYGTCITKDKAIEKISERKGQGFFCIENVAACAEWINWAPKIKKYAEETSSSYGFKHFVERAIGRYVSEGEFVLASLWWNRNLVQFTNHISRKMKVSALNFIERDSLILLKNRPSGHDSLFTTIPIDPDFSHFANIFCYEGKKPLDELMDYKNLGFKLNKEQTRSLKAYQAMETKYVQLKTNWNKHFQSPLEDLDIMATSQNEGFSCFGLSQRSKYVIQKYILGNGKECKCGNPRIHSYPFAKGKEVYVCETCHKCFKTRNVLLCEDSGLPQMPEGELNPEVMRKAISSISIAKNMEYGD